MNITDLCGHINGIKITFKASYRLGFQNVVVGSIDGMVGSTGFSYKKVYMYGCFARTEKTGYNNQVIIRQGSTVLECGCGWS